MKPTEFRPYLLACILGLALAAGADVACGTPPAIDLDSLASPAGRILDGTSAGDTIGRTVAHLGDVNADGLGDIGIGGDGTTYVVFGTTIGIPSAFELADLDGSNGFVAVGIAPNGTASIVRAAGDVNHDGIDDLAIGDQSAGSDGTVYVIFGSAGGFSASFDLTTLDGTNGFATTGASGEFAGVDLAPAGDVNGDGIDDLLIGGLQAHGITGGAWVVFGSDSSFPATLPLASLDGTNGFGMRCPASSFEGGQAVCGAGDVNGDGLADVIVNDFLGEDPNGDRPGVAYVAFGSNAGFPALLDLSTLDGTNGFAIYGSSPLSNLSASIAGVGDVNGDEIDDIALGAPNTDSGIGAAYVIFGSTAPFDAWVGVASLDGTNGFKMAGSSESDGIGHTLSEAGDANGDGLGDILLGVPRNSVGGVQHTGQAFVVFGTRSTSAVVALESLDGSNGFSLDGSVAASFVGTTVAGGGDLNGDGAADLLVAAPFADPEARVDAGTVYVVYGLTCMTGTVNRDAGSSYDVLFVNGDNGGADRTLETPSSQLLSVTVLNPGLGNGRFVMHANEGSPDPLTQTVLPFRIGTSCFPFLLSQGASPVIIADNTGKDSLVGSSAFYGVPWADPDRATTSFLLPNLPAGAVLTFQAIVFDPGSASHKGASVSNAVVVEVVP